jgi:putative ABC transport system ATP-binding protein
MLKMSDVGKVYRTELVETHALRDLSLHVDEGEFVAVTGPSGSGKTTFLNIAGLLESPSSGRYELDGTDVSRLNDRQRSRTRNEKVGFIFQSFNLIPDLSLADNVDVPLRYRGWSGVERRKAVGDARPGRPRFAPGLLPRSSPAAQRASPSPARWPATPLPPG